MNDRITTAGRLAPLLFLFIILLATRVHAQNDVISFSSDRWELKKAEIANHLGRECLSGTAYLKDTEFENGVIEVDIAVDGTRSYPGIVFRMQSEDDYERFYVRPHRAGLYPDALQYTPVFNGAEGWQLYSGRGFTAAADIPANQWVHLKMEIMGSQARVYLNDAEDPVLIIDDLKHGSSKGSIGVQGPKDTTAYFSNFRYRKDDTLQFEDPPQAKTPPGTITEWEISRAFKTNRLNTKVYPRFFTIFAANWEEIEPEATGLVNISRYAKRRGAGADCILARTIIRSEKKQDITFSFGYSDEVTVFLNGNRVFSGNSAYRSRDPSFLGVVGFHDAVYLPLQKGLNEIFLIVKESFGGWGFMGRTDTELDRPVKQHGRLVKIWETADTFKVPESVLYDPQKEILYVSSFNKVQPGSDHAGFISKVKLNGEIENLEWITGLDGPCGMAIRGKKLFVVECSGNMVEIDKNAGNIIKRYPVPNMTFLNDVAVDKSGNIYISDTSGQQEGNDIYRFKDGKIEVWKDGDEIHRANGLFVHGNNLIVGNSGDGLLKSINLDDGRVDVITSLGAGTIDGIRVDNEGNYIVSHWEGQTYLISPAGEVTEIMDTQKTELNTADFEFINKKNMLIVPTFLGNRVVAYELVTE